MTGAGAGGGARGGSQPFLDWAKRSWPVALPYSGAHGVSEAGQPCPPPSSPGHQARSASRSAGQAALRPPTSSFPPPGCPGFRTFVAAAAPWSWPLLSWSFKPCARICVKPAELAQG